MTELYGNGPPNGGNFGWNSGDNDRCDPAEQPIRRANGKTLCCLHPRS